MDKKLTLGNMMPSASPYRGFELQGSMNVNHHHNPQGLHQHHHSQPGQGLVGHPSMPEAFPLEMGLGHNIEHLGSGGKNSATDEDEQSPYEEGGEGQSDRSKGKRVYQWQRVKWTDVMVKLLMTALSYLTEEAVFEGCHGERRRYLNLHKKGKWKCVSKVMAERGFLVSPQQCEDKYNDLNKRYKKLNEILGKGIACEVVEKPALLDMMDHLCEKAKEEVRKILSSKQLFYEEMCSYLHHNRLCLPHDPAVQQSVLMALRSRDDNDIGSKRDLEDIDEDDHDMDTDEHEEYEQNCGHGSYAFSEDPSKRMKQGLGLGDFSFGSPSAPDSFKGFQLQSQNPSVDMSGTVSENQKFALQEQWLESRSRHIEEQKLKLEMKTLELENQRCKWQRYCKRKDRELEKLKEENEKIELENGRIELELKRMEMSKNSKD